MNTLIEQRGEHGVVTLHGALNAGVADRFRDQCVQWLKEHENVRRLVLDLEEMEFIDSAGLGVLISLLKRLGERGGDIRLARMQKKARVVFQITRTYKIFEIFDSVAEALSAEA
jgi:anti-anti-sigma factor